MRKIKYIVLSFFGVVVFGMISCTKMDDYLKYTNGEEILYTGKVDSVIVHSGKERVVISGLLISDPKITKIKIYWNNRTDSLLMDITRTAGVDTLRVPISLPERTYNFEIFTFDKEGHSSIVVNASGSSYGQIYQQTLLNRAMKKVEKVGNNVVIDWYTGEQTSPFTRINYTDSKDVEHVLRIRNDSVKTTLYDIKSASKFKMQTFFLPDTVAVDTFAAVYQMVGFAEDITNAFIKNPGNPFLRSDNGIGKWGLLKDWQYTANVINQNENTAGGWSSDGNPSGVIHFESQDWSGPGITNGKIYQSFTLPDGLYSVEFARDGGGGTIDANLVVANGTVLPDITDLGGVLASYHWDQNASSGTRTVNFSLDQPTTVVVGWVFSTGSTTWQHINEIKLHKLADPQ